MNQLEWLLFGVLVFAILIIVVNIADNLFTGKETFISRLFRRKHRRSSKHPYPYTRTSDHKGEREAAPRSHARQKQEPRKRR
ncbi:hypothetical protein ccbrp13_08210 [Ktedonobacteria bacterium brp13]|nr:hypothetical protein ccbrp13_08210 [Ktedonobacteria bacterium brp13]